MQRSLAHAGRALAVSILGLGLAACTDPRVERLAAAPDDLQGLTRAEVLSCAGVPEREAQEGPLTFLTYEASQIEQRERASLGVGLGHGRGGLRTGVGLGFPILVDSFERRCEATFTLRDDKVERLVLTGSEHGRTGLCFSILEPCLPPPPEPKE